MRQLVVGEPGCNCGEKFPIGFTQRCGQAGQLAPCVDGIVQAPCADAHLAFVVGAHSHGIVASFSVSAPMKS